MKRLLVAAILAFAVHGIFLSVSFTDREKSPSISLPTQRITVSLSHRKPQPPQEKKPEKPMEKTADPVPVVPVESKPAPRKMQVKPKVEPEKPSIQSEVVEQQEKVASPEEDTVPELHGMRQPEPAEQSSEASESDDSAVIREARPLYRLNPPPKYPRIARERGYQGTVFLEVLVDSKGKVDDVKVHDSSGYQILDKAAMKAVKGWTFEPGQRGSNYVTMWVSVPVRFELE